MSRGITNGWIPASIRDAVHFNTKGRDQRVLLGTEPGASPKPREFEDLVIRDIFTPFRNTKVFLKTAVEYEMDIYEAYRILMHHALGCEGRATR